MIKKDLSREYGVPLFPPKPKPPNLTPGAKVHPYNVRRAAVALKTQGRNLPEARRHELQQLVRGYVNQDKPGSQLDGKGWLSPEEMEQALLTGLAPRQKRRTLRKLAAEKAGNVQHTSLTAQSDEDAAQHGDSSAEEGDAEDSANGIQVGTESHEHGSMQRHSSADEASQQDASDALQQHANAAVLASHADANANEQPADSDARAEAAMLHGGDNAQQDVQVQQYDTHTSAEDSNGHFWHGKNVVAAALAEGGTDSLLLLIQRFRKAFTDALHPQFLPAAWHVMHRWVLSVHFGQLSVSAASVLSNLHAGDL